MWQLITRALFVLRRDCMRDWIPTHWSPRAKAWARVGSHCCWLGQNTALLKATRNFTGHSDEGHRAAVDGSALSCSSGWEQFDDDNQSAAVAEQKFDNEVREWCFAHGFLLCGVCQAVVKVDPSKLKPRQPGVRVTVGEQILRFGTLLLHSRANTRLPPPSPAQPQPQLRRRAAQRLHQ